MEMTRECRSCSQERPLSDYEPTRLVCRDCRSLQKKLQKFSISEADYNKLFEQQNGRCAICNTHQCSTGKALAIDHDHKTGKVRGLLCMPCNTAIGKLNDDPILVQRAADYLRSTSG